MPRAHPAAPCRESCTQSAGRVPHYPARLLTQGSAPGCLAERWGPNREKAVSTLGDTDNSTPCPLPGEGSLHTDPQPTCACSQETPGGRALSVRLCMRTWCNCTVCISISSTMSARDGQSVSQPHTSTWSPHTPAQVGVSCAPKCQASFQDTAAPITQGTGILC